ncbi:hypothetical protein LTR05_001377 [Lithohypha guttulata]|uniref:Uncharacterized protein n=1 Tax=Lithohypha guttulata TaxID=1690604 RepID=A0AAN7YAB1_9EURO|nr:hypothetical protein LTR05_001377 [Lithohypha guttulata]
MSEYLPTFPAFIEPVLRQARRFSSRAPADEQPGILIEPSPTAAGYFPMVQVPDFQRFYPSRFWHTNTLPPHGRDETTEGTWQSLARNIQLWANQINNLDVIPSPPLDAMPGSAIDEDDANVAFPPLDFSVPTPARPVRLEEHRTDSETSLNPAEELPYRSRALAQAQIDRGHSQSDPISHPGMLQPAARLDPQVPIGEDDEYRRRDGSGQLPEDDGMGDLRQRISAIMAGQGNPAEKSKLIHILMNEKYRNAHSPPPSRGRPRPQHVEHSTLLTSPSSSQMGHTMFNLSAADLNPTYAPPDVDEDGTVQQQPDLGCQHYKRNIKMQCATCEKWYTCRLCHDEVEDHTLPRRDTRFMAETTHKCIEKSTKSDCPICGDYMFTSNRPVAFMKCGHSIHETCFNDWCKTSYKCPICSKSIANMESQFRRLDRHIEEQPMPEEYQNNRAYVFCNDCNSRSITKHHWLGTKCSICDSYNTTQLELLGPEQTPQQMRELTERAQEFGEAGLTASQTQTPVNELTSPAMDVPLNILNTVQNTRAQSPQSPHLLPHSPTRSARSITPVVGSYFGTGQRVEPDRRNSYFSIFSAGQPATPQGSGHNNDDNEMDFWGGRSTRSQDADMEELDASDGSSSSSSDEHMMDNEDDAGEDLMDLPGHR